MSSTPQFNEEQLASVRARRWHQQGDALLTLEAAQAWVEELGLVLFAPRAQQLAIPAPSLVEATMGRAVTAPTAAEAETARGFVARLTADGAALPLNLLGGPGDVPDFVVSAQVFSYVFTLRGDKLWKQAPATSGAMKVSLLAAKVYETLAAGSALTAAELASELGREVTEAAIGRALGELWAQLRVIPLQQQNGSATMWELTSRRFTKAMKAGANAGLPTALSALVSLYLTQVYAAAEEEIETFLSPLTARSRARDVLHGLTGARQLETVVLDGKTLLYIAGDLPAFPEVVAAVEEGSIAEAVAPVPPKKVGTGRIRRFEGERGASGGLRSRPSRSSGGERSRPAGARPSARFGARAEGKSDREQRPFRREAAGGDRRPGFTKPWNEERKPRPQRSASEGAADSFKKFRKPADEERKPLGDREQAGLPPEKRVFSKPRFERESKARDFAKRPYRPRAEGGERGEFKPRSFDRGGREGGGKPGGFGGKRPYKPRETAGAESSFTKRPYTSRTTERGEGGFSKPKFERGGKTGGFGAKRPYKPRDTEGGERTFTKRPYTPRTSEAGERSFSKPRFDRGAQEGGKPGGFGGKRPYKSRAAEGGERSEGSSAKRPYKPRGEGSSDRGGAAPGRGYGAKKFGAKPAGRFGGKPGAKPGGSGKFGPKKFGAKPGGFGAKRGGPSGKTKAAPRRPKAEE